MLQRSRDERARRGCNRYDARVACAGLGASSIVLEHLECAAPIRRRDSRASCPVHRNQRRREDRDPPRRLGASNALILTKSCPAPAPRATRLCRRPWPHRGGGLAWAEPAASCGRGRLCCSSPGTAAVHAGRWACSPPPCPIRGAAATWSRTGGGPSGRSKPVAACT